MSCHKRFTMTPGQTGDNSPQGNYKAINSLISSFHPHRFQGIATNVRTLATRLLQEVLSLVTNFTSTFAKYTSTIESRINSQQKCPRSVITTDESLQEWFGKLVEPRRAPPPCPPCPQCPEFPGCPEFPRCPQHVTALEFGVLFGVLFVLLVLSIMAIR